MSDETNETREVSRRLCISATLFFFTLAMLSHEARRAIPAYVDWLKSISMNLYLSESAIREILICVVGLYAVHRLRPRAMLDELGLLANPLIGIGLSLVACLPMALVPAIFGGLNPDLSARGVVFGAFVWPFAEEFVFRAYAFKQLADRAKLGMWPAAIIVGIVFGVLHLGNATVQAQPIGEQVGVVLITGLGGILFSWIYYRWNYNFWVPFGMHALMNLSWELFALGDTALGGWVPNVLRLMTVALAIGMTLKWTRAAIRETSSAS